MVRLDRIYTRSGDGGDTSLGDGSRLAKHHPRVAAYGTVDELSSVIGLALVEGLKAPFDAWLLTVQNDLFDVGADLCVPGEAGAKLRITQVYVDRLESQLDEVNDGLAELGSFILPGGTKAAAWLHLARTVCRRAERLVSELSVIEGEEVNPLALTYLNRLSDFLFVLARAENDGGQADVLWKPGGGAH